MEITLAFIPIFIFTILAEALVIQARHGSYSWKNTGVSTLVAVGHFLVQTALRGVIFGIIAAGVYAVRLTTIPVSFHNWPSLIALFLLTDLAFYVEHRCSHRIRLMWASHSVHHSTDRMVASAAFRLSWTPILSGVLAFYLPIRITRLSSKPARPVTSLTACSSATWISARAGTGAHSGSSSSSTWSSRT
jgi:sterol desaturase/sphingolipid hydroxylase (fatty acid hydroxylase superfamily)